jgi:hypothetical protein
MKTLCTFALIFASALACSQSWRANGVLASAPPPPTGTLRFHLPAGTVHGAQTICIYVSTCGDIPANDEVFYTLDGSAATPASTWYPCKSSTAGCVIIPATTTTRTVTVNAVLVQMVSTTAPGCSSGSPCIGVIVQDSTLVQNRLKLNLSCSAAQCPASHFTRAPSSSGSPDWGSGTGRSNGVAGVVSAASFEYGMSQPSVDLYGNTNTANDYQMSTAGSSSAGGPDTEYLVNYDSASQALSSTGCPHCTNFDVSRYIAHAYTGTTGTSQNAANLADLESDDNLYDSSQGTSTQCGASPSVACYGAFNFRCAPADLTVTVSGTKYGGYQHSSQTSDWQSFNPAVTVIPSHDCTYPFGTVGTMDATTCNLTFTPGNVNYNSQKSWGIEAGGYLLIDQGNASAETVFLINPSGNTVTGANGTNCIRGVGTAAHAHSAGALASMTVLFQAGAIKDTTTGGTCTTGTREPVAMYYNYLSMNGNVYGTAAAQALMPGTTVLDTWGTQTVNGTPHSKLCDYYGLSEIFDYGTGRFFDQVQPYIKLGSGIVAQVGIFTMHDNFTAHFGIIGSPSQSVYTQSP